MSSQRKTSVNECGKVCMCEPIDVSEANIRDYCIHIGKEAVRMGAGQNCGIRHEV